MGLKYSETICGTESKYGFYESWLLNVCSTPETGGEKFSIMVLYPILCSPKTPLQGRSCFCTSPKRRVATSVDSKLLMLLHRPWESEEEVCA